MRVRGGLSGPAGMTLLMFLPWVLIYGWLAIGLLLYGAALAAGRYQQLHRQIMLASEGSDTNT